MYNVNDIMPKGIIDKTQIKQLGKKITEEFLKEPKEMARAARGQLLGERIPQETREGAWDEETLRRMKEFRESEELSEKTESEEASRAVKIRRLRGQLEKEIEKVRQEKKMKEEEVRVEEERALSEEGLPKPLKEPAAKRPRLFAGLGRWRRRAKVAREKSMAEMVGRRRGG